MAETSEIALGTDQNRSKMECTKEHVSVPEDGEIFDEQDEEKAEETPLDPSDFDDKVEDDLVLEEPKEEPQYQAPLGWRRRALCKFFRRGFCQNGVSCAYSHNAADSRRVPALCRFYADGFCKSGAECNMLHGEFPCKNFHKGLCKDRYCRFSHEPLNEFTQPIYDEMLEEEALIANISISLEPKKRKVLLPTPQCVVPLKPVQNVKAPAPQIVGEEGGLFSGMLEEMSKTTPDTFPRDENWRICATAFQNVVYRLIPVDQPPLEFDREFLAKLKTDKFAADPRVELMLKKAEEKPEKETVPSPPVVKCASVQDPRLPPVYSLSSDLTIHDAVPMAKSEPMENPFTGESPFMSRAMRMNVADVSSMPIKTNLPPRFASSWTDWREPPSHRHQRGNYRSRREDHQREERGNHGPYQVNRSRGMERVAYPRNPERQCYERNRGRRSSDRRSLPRDYRNCNV